MSSFVFFVVFDFFDFFDFFVFFVVKEDVMRRTLWIALGIGGLLITGGAARAQGVGEKPCTELLLPLREAQGAKVGPSACKMQESVVVLDGRRYQRLDVGLDGTVDGYLPKTGMYINYFTNGPDLVFPTGLNDGPIFHGVAHYTADTGAAMTIVYPDRKAWNGKMWVTVHGRGQSFKRGNLKAWDRNLNPADTASDLDKFERAMLTQGFVVVKTHRTSETLGGDVQVRLDDGTIYPERNLNDNSAYVLDFARLAKRAVQKWLGRPPARTYFYGHSAGARIGRSLNYVPGLNTGADGKAVFDGILADDSATGLWLPLVMKDGKDVLFATDAQKAAFVPMLEVSHQNYNAESPGEKAAWASPNYLVNKRQNARILRDKGLGAKHRMYEVRGLSHQGGEGFTGDRRGDQQVLDLVKMMERFVGMLDAWVDKGVAPPPTRSDWAELGDADRDGTIEHPALAYPEVACPLGVYAQYPPSLGSNGTGTTWFVPFTGSGLEPLDGRKQFVDLNRNGVWDFRETPTEAWRRLGLLGAGGALTGEKYVACVQAAAGALAKDGFFSAKTAAAYVEQAKKTELGPAKTTTEQQP